MAKSASQKFDEYLRESRETNDAINEFTKASYDNHGNYAYAAKRAELRGRFATLAQTQKNELLLKQIKDSDKVDPWKVVTV
jgi:hypothetical protein